VVRAPIIAAFFAALLFAGSGCGRAALPAPAPGKLQVVTTTTQLRDLLQQVGGGRVQVTSLLAPNVDPHDFSPTPSTARAIAGADLFVVSGAGLDDWGRHLLASAGTSTPTLVASAGLPLRRIGGDVDPHWWHDPTLFARATLRVASRLAELDPRRRGLYRRNARHYVAQLHALDRQNRALVACVPAGQRKLVTNHDAFGYLAAHYGLRVVGSVVPSLSTAAEASAAHVATLVRGIRAQHVRAIFTESSIDPRLERQIAREAGVAVRADLYGDTLGPAGSPGATYLGMERWNVRAIVTGLLGHPPPAGGC
jgi:zinc/manganese transport system substrate-binding protein/manganese/iron transport system substrate-binding protein